MTKTELSFPELGLLVGTRGMLGAGLGLLPGDKLSEDKRKGVGWTLAAIGVLSALVDPSAQRARACDALDQCRLPCRLADERAADFQRSSGALLGAGL